MQWRLNSCCITRGVSVWAWACMRARTVVKYGHVPAGLCWLLLCLELLQIAPPFESDLGWMQTANSVRHKRRFSLLFQDCGGCLIALKSGSFIREGFYTIIKYNSIAIQTYVVLNLIFYLYSFDLSLQRKGLYQTPSDSYNLILISQLGSHFIILIM